MRSCTYRVAHRARYEDVVELGLERGDPHRVLYGGIEGDDRDMTTDLGLVAGVDLGALKHRAKTDQARDFVWDPRSACRAHSP